MQTPVLTDPELRAAFCRREMQVERNLNIVRAYIAVFFIVLDIMLTWLSGKYSFHMSLLFAGLGIIFSVYFCLIQYICSSDVYVPWLKYITVTVDYLFLMGVFVEYHSTRFFLNMPREIVVFHFIAFIMLLNMLSIARYSRTVILYSTFLAISAGGYLLLRYVPVSWSTWFTALLILFSGFITYFFSNDLYKLFFKLRMHERLKRFLSGAVVQNIESGQININLGGQKKHVTVLFADIRNFSQFSEQHDAFEVVSLLNCFFTEMTDIIFKYEGVVDKFIGDALMAVFGTPISRSDDAVRAVRAGIAMLKRLVELNSSWHDQHIELRVGIAIHSGDVVAGNIGSERRMDYTVIGETVNMAARIENLNKRFHTTMLISEATCCELDNQIELRFVAETTVRGMSRPIRLFTPVMEFIDSKSFIDVEYLLSKTRP